MHCLPVIMILHKVASINLSLFLLIYFRKLLSGDGIQRTQPTTKATKAVLLVILSPPILGQTALCGWQERKHFSTVSRLCLPLRKGQVLDSGALGSGVCSLSAVSIAYCSLLLVTWLDLVASLMRFGHPITMLRTFWEPLTMCIHI